MCPMQSDWFGVGDFGGSQFRNVDRSVVTKFLHVHPADYSTMKVQVLWKLWVYKCTMREAMLIYEQLQQKLTRGKRKR